MSAHALGRCGVGGEGWGWREITYVIVDGGVSVHVHALDERRDALLHVGEALLCVFVGSV